MAMVGEWVQWAMAWTGGAGSYSASWSIEMPPSTVLAKVGFNFYMEYGDVGMVSPGIISIRRRRPDNSDETIPMNNTTAFFNSNVTNITYGMYIYDCQAQVVLDIGYWQ
jgi:hypothetical protein